MDSLVCAMSVMTPSEMMSRMKYCEPSVIAEAYLPSKKERGQRSAGLEEEEEVPEVSRTGGGGDAGSGSKPIGLLLMEALLPPSNIRVSPAPTHPKIKLFIARPMSQSGR